MSSADSLGPPPSGDWKKPKTSLSCTIDLITGFQSPLLVAHRLGDFMDGGFTNVQGRTVRRFRARSGHRVVHMGGCTVPAPGSRIL